MSNSSDIFGIKFFCPRWGANDSWDDFCKRVKEAGYDGIESVHSLDPKLQKEELTALEKYELKIIGQYYQSFESNFDEHLKSFEKHLRNLVSANPIFINSQTGKDWFSFEQNKKIFETAFRIQKETGVKIVHETHRGKCLFAAHVTKEYLMKIPDINLTLDISHWCNVHESLLADQKETIDLALARTEHIHARIGHPEGPQVNDPRAPEKNQPHRPQPQPRTINRHHLPKPHAERRDHHHVKRIRPRPPRDPIPHREHHHHHQHKHTGPNEIPLRSAKSLDHQTSPTSQFP
jgi:sugar phosphate isomerase/epimerase